MLKTVLLLNIFVETMIPLKHLSKILKREKLIILFIMHESDKIDCQSLNRLYWRDARDNQIRLIAQP